MLQVDQMCSGSPRFTTTYSGVVFWIFTGFIAYRISSYLKLSDKYIRKISRQQMHLNWELQKYEKSKQTTSATQTYEGSAFDICTIHYVSENFGLYH